MKLKISFPVLCLTAVLSLSILCGCRSSVTETRPTLKFTETTRYYQGADGSLKIYSYAKTTYDYSDNTAVNTYATGINTYADDPGAIKGSSLETEFYSFTIDSEGRIINESHDDGGLVEYVYSDQGGYGYNNLVQVKITNKNWSDSDYLIETTYNDVGLASHTIVKLPDFDLPLSVISYEYENLEYDVDSPLSPIYVLCTASDGEISYVELSYDSLGSCTSVVTTDEAGTELRKDLFFYDSHGSCVHEEVYFLGINGLYLYEETNREFDYDE